MVILVRLDVGGVKDMVCKFWGCHGILQAYCSIGRRLTGRM